MPPTVAICQASITLGGRLRVILSMIEALNELGIEPDILTARLRFDPAVLPERYGKHVRASWRVIGPALLGRLRQDARVLGFHGLLLSMTRGHDILINSSNSLIGLPRNKVVISYVHFPRKARLLSEAPHEPGEQQRLRTRLAERAQRLGVRLGYRALAADKKQIVISNTHFTEQAVVAAHGRFDDMRVIYPPVDLATYRTERSARTDAVVTLGRFVAAKRQLDQIELARTLPHLQFHIAGFAGGGEYYRACEAFVKRHDIRNVHLHPDAPLETIVELLRTSKYFLHTLIAEPFGLTAVQAIAAGCIPIVHDSGGQRETVVLPELRYQALHEVPAMLARLDALSDDERQTIRTTLMDNAAQFDEACFVEQFGEVLAEAMARVGR